MSEQQNTETKEDPLQAEGRDDARDVVDSPLEKDTVTKETVAQETEAKEIEAKETVVKETVANETVDKKTMTKQTEEPPEIESRLVIAVGFLFGFLLGYAPFQLWRRIM